MDNIEKQQNKKETLDNIDVNDGLYTGSGSPIPTRKDTSGKHNGEEVINKPFNLGITMTLFSSAIAFLTLTFIINSHTFSSGAVLIAVLFFLSIVSFAYFLSLVFTGGYYLYRNRKSKKRINTHPYLWAIIPAILITIVIFVVTFSFIDMGITEGLRHII